MRSLAFTFSYFLIAFLRLILQRNTIYYDNFIFWFDLLRILRYMYNIFNKEIVFALL